MNPIELAGDCGDEIYERAVLLLSDLLEQARQDSGGDHSAAALATTDKDARPSVRIVDVVKVSKVGILFFANQLTGKGQQMQHNPRAGLCFHWPVLSQQVTIEGDVVMVANAEADAVWSHRPRDVGLGHWASDQAAAPEEEAELKERLSELKKQHSLVRVPRPPDWCAYEIHPDRIEFWKTGWGRLKSRMRFMKGHKGIWTEEKLNP